MQEQVGGGGVQCYRKQHFSISESMHTNTEGLIIAQKFKSFDMYVCQWRKAQVKNANADNILIHCNTQQPKFEIPLTASLTPVHGKPLNTVQLP
jgi:hypothetical protein